MTLVGASRAARTVVAAMLALLLSAPCRVDAEAGPKPVAAASPTPAAPRPDLVVDLAGPTSARPGETIGERVRLTVTNAGVAPAWGTRDHPSGYMIDLTLGRDAVLSVGFKAYSPHFAEDVLLEGGRVSKTTDLAPGAARRYAVVVVVPADVTTGRYHLCAYVDPGNVVAESEERNNTACSPLRIVPASSAGGRGSDRSPPGGGRPPADEP